MTNTQLVASFTDEQVSHIRGTLNTQVLRELTENEKEFSDLIVARHRSTLRGVA